MTHEGWSQLVVVAEGDYIVQYGSRHGRWHGGRFMGVEADAGSYDLGSAAMYRFVGDRIAERWAVRDDLTMLRQLACAHGRTNGNTRAARRGTSTQAASQAHNISHAARPIGRRAGYTSVGSACAARVG